MNARPMGDFRAPVLDLRQETAEHWGRPVGVDFIMEAVCTGPLMGEHGIKLDATVWITPEQRQALDRPELRRYSSDVTDSPEGISFQFGGGRLSIKTVSSDQL